MDNLDIPEFLLVRNRKPLTAEQRGRVETLQRAAHVTAGPADTGPGSLARRLGYDTSMDEPAMTETQEQLEAAAAVKRFKTDAERYAFFEEKAKEKEEIERVGFEAAQAAKANRKLFRKKAR